MEMNKIEALNLYKKYFNDNEFMEFLELPYILEDSDDFKNYYPEGTPNLFSKENNELLLTVYKLDEDTLSVTVAHKK